jgi:hypothetical protein
MHSEGGPGENSRRDSAREKSDFFDILLHATFVEFDNLGPSRH